MLSRPHDECNIEATIICEFCPCSCLVIGKPERCRSCFGCDCSRAADPRLLVAATCHTGHRDGKQRWVRGMCLEQVFLALHWNYDSHLGRARAAAESF